MTHSCLTDSEVLEFRFPGNVMVTETPGRRGMGRLDLTWPAQWEACE